MKKKAVKQYSPSNDDQDKAAENLGDDRTPDKKIGEIGYAEKAERKQSETG